MKAYVKDHKVYLVFDKDLWRMTALFDILLGDDDINTAGMRICSFGQYDNAIEIQIKEER